MTTEIMELNCSGCGKNIGCFFIQDDSLSHEAEKVLGNPKDKTSDEFLCNDCRPEIQKEFLKVSLNA